MSNTGRKNGAKRVKHDFYPTDERVIRALLRAIDQGMGPPLPGLRRRRGPPPIWAEPCVGDGAIVRAVESYRSGGRIWFTADIRPETNADIIGDFLAPGMLAGADVYITNPPFKYAQEVADACLARRARRGHVALLVRFGFLTAVKRLAFNKKNPWDVYPLSPRPSFGLNKHGKKGTDGTEYVWLLNGPGRGGRIFPALYWRHS